MLGSVRKGCVRSFVAVGLFLIANAYSISQNLVNRVYNLDDGLPSSHVYCVEQDTMGYIWAITDYGLTRYNGQTFANYDISNGFTDRGGFHIYKDKRGGLWFIPFNGRICYFDGKTFKQPSFFNDENFEPVAWMTEDSQGNKCFTTRTGKLLICKPDGRIIKIQVSDNAAYCVAELSPDIYLVLAETIMKWVNLKTGKTGLVSGYYNDFMKADYPRLKKLKDDRILLTTSEGVFLVKPDLSLKLVIATNEKFGSNNEIFNIYEDGEGNVWMPGRIGLMKFDASLNLNNVGLFFKNYNILTVIKDREDNIWMATTWGLLKAHSEGAYCVSKVDGLVSDHVQKLYADKNNIIWAINYEGSIYSLNGNKILLEGQNISTTTIDAHTLRNISEHELFVGGNTKAVLFNTLTKKQKQLFSSTSPLYYLLSKNDTTYFIDHKGAGFFNKGNREYYYTMPDVWSLGLWPNVAERDNEGNIWIGDKQGLVKITTGGDYINMTDRVPACKVGVEQIQITTKGEVWVANTLNDIYCISHNKVLAHKVLLPLGRRIKNITLSHDTILWVATNNGAYKYAIDKNNNLQKIFYCNTDNAMVSDDVNDILVNGSNVYFATNRGISVINQKLYRQKDIHPQVEVTRCYLGSIDATAFTGNTIEADYKNNSLSVDVATAVYSWGKVAYKYRLEPLDTGWEFTHSANIKYSSLPPGNYTFRVKAANFYGYESNKEKTFSFYIKKPYWQTIWFWALIFIGGSAIVYLLIKRRLNAIRHEADLQKGLVEAQLKALRLQMNPHFIFNTLQSIQDYIITNQSKLAITYLSKFSKLVRKALDFSKHNFITLQEDIEMLDLYVELEAARYNGKLEFVKKIGTDIDTERVQIPPMLIQPFIENAIKHGVNATGGGVIHLTVYNEKGFLSIEVKDNGIGRAAANKTGALKAGHKSTGISQTTERLGMVFTNYGLKGSITITDLYENEKPVGTQVVIKIPYADG